MHVLALLIRAAGILFAVGTLPLTIELILLSAAAVLPLRRRSVPAGHVNLVAVVPAHNEEALIRPCLESLKATHVYVVAHNCTDRTAAYASSFSHVTLLRLDDSLGGKGRALDYGFTSALAGGADAILVIDADSTAGPNLLPEMRARFVAGAAAVQCRYEVANRDASPRTRLTALALLGMNVLRPRGRARLGLSCGIFGNGFALSAETLRMVPYTANSLVEDLEYHLHLLRAGRHVDFIDNASVLGEMPVHNAAAATQRARWEGGRMLMRGLWAGPLFLDLLRGRFRMLEPLLDLLALPLATQAGFLAVVFAAGITGRAWWLWTYASLGLGAILVYVMVSASLDRDPAGSLKALAYSPGYLLWKILLIPKTRMARRKDAAWIRTGRNAEGD